MSSVLKKADKLNLSLSLSLSAVGHWEILCPLMQSAERNVFDHVKFELLRPNRDQRWDIGRYCVH